jgi:hypothetical protein
MLSARKGSDLGPPFYEGAETILHGDFFGPTRMLPYDVSKASLQLMSWGPPPFSCGLWSRSILRILHGHPHDCAV